MASDDGEPQEAAGGGEEEEKEKEKEKEEVTPSPPSLPPLPLLLLPAPPPATAPAPAPAPASSSPLPPRILSLHKLSQSAKKPPGTWTPAETFHLINTYQEKWYALKRGQLRTIHWDEVAEKLASLCHGLPDLTPKSSMQCRHKLEKLRRRYRAEAQLILRKGPAMATAAGSWPFFVQMDHMERGPSAPPLQAQHYQFHADPRQGASHNALPAAAQETNIVMNESTTISLDEDSDQPPPRVFATRKRRMHHHQHHHHQNPYHKEDHGADSAKKANKKKPVNGGSSSSSKREKSREASPVNPGPPPPPNPPWHEMGGHSDVQQASELAYLVRALGENFLRMEQLKIQMQRENELFRADMELRRTEMVIDSQKQIAELFSEAMMNMQKKTTTKKMKKDQPTR